MIVHCFNCSSAYDDAECWTTCPHGPLWASAGSYCRRCDTVDCARHGVGRFPKPDPIFPQDRPVFGPIGNWIADAWAAVVLQAAKLRWRVRLMLGSNPTDGHDAPVYPRNSVSPPEWSREFCRLTGFPDHDWAMRWFAAALHAGYCEGRKAERSRRALVRLWDVNTGECKLITPGDEETGVNETPRVTLKGGTYEVEFRELGDDVAGMESLAVALRDRDRASRGLRTTGLAR